jgi:hypothetical protein
MEQNVKTVVEQVAESIANLSEGDRERLATVLHRQHEEVAINLMRDISMVDMSVTVGRGVEFDNWPV